MASKKDMRRSDLSESVPQTDQCSVDLPLVIPYVEPPDEKEGDFSSTLRFLHGKSRW